ncbi:PDZ domain-containing protein [Streptomyces sp. PD-S100-1]|uniref:PDZ domain-containing protein n=1 Tax=Streptomyces sp. PD-S100-1 TaxID=3394351 RepID=UPI0039BCD9DD
MEHTALRPKPMPGREPGGGGAPDADRPAAAPRRGRRAVAVTTVLLAGLILLLAGIGLGAVAGTVIGLTRTAGHGPPPWPVGAPGVPSAGSGPAGSGSAPAGPFAPGVPSAGAGRAGTGSAAPGAASARSGPADAGGSAGSPAAGGPAAGPLAADSATGDRRSAGSTPRDSSAAGSTVPDSMTAHGPTAGFAAVGSPGARSVPSPPRTALGIEAVDDDGRGARVTAVEVPGPGSAAGLARGDVLLAFGGTRVASAADLSRAVARARPGRAVTVTVRGRDGRRRWLTLTPDIAP